MKTGRVLALVTARGGSKGLPGKNLKPLAGKPLLAWSVSAGLGCPRVWRTAVSTEDPAIKAAARAAGAEVIDRPAALAGDLTTSADVVAHALESFGADRPEHFVLLQPTSPFRTARHVTECLDAYLASDAACSISVAEAAHPPQKDFTLEGGLLRPLFSEDLLNLPRQALPKVYAPNGALYVMASDLFLERRAFFVPPALPFVMSAEDSVDIDTPLDFALAEIVAARRER